MAKVTLGYLTAPFKTAWSAVGRTLVVDAKDRQVVRPAAELGGLDWHDYKHDWEQLAPVLARAPELFDLSNSLTLGAGVSEQHKGFVLVPEDRFIALDKLLKEMTAAIPARKDVPYDPTVDPEPTPYRR